MSTVYFSAHGKQQGKIHDARALQEKKYFPQDSKEFQGNQGFPQGHSFSMEKSHDNKFLPCQKTLGENQLSLEKSILALLRSQGFTAQDLPQEEQKQQNFHSLEDPISKKIDETLQGNSLKNLHHHLKGLHPQPVEASPHNFHHGYPMKEDLLDEVIAQESRNFQKGIPIHENAHKAFSHPGHGKKSLEYGETTQDHHDFYYKETPEEKSHQRECREFLSLLMGRSNNHGGSQKSFPLEVLKKHFKAQYVYLSPLRYLSSVFNTTQQYMTLPLYNGHQGVQWNDPEPKMAPQDFPGELDPSKGYSAEARDISLNALSLSRCIPCYLMDNVKGVRSWMETHCLKDLLEEENRVLFLGEGAQGQKPQGLLRRDLDFYKDLVVDISLDNLPNSRQDRNNFLLNAVNEAMGLSGRYNTQNTCWLIHGDFANILRTLTLSTKTAWTYNAKGQEFLFGRPVYVVDLPIKGFYAAFGDMEQGYAHVRHENFYLLVDPYSRAPHTKIHMRYCLGGGILDPQSYTMMIDRKVFEESLRHFDGENKHKDHDFSSSPSPKGSLHGNLEKKEHFAPMEEINDGPVDFMEE